MPIYHRRFNIRPSTVEDLDDDGDGLDDLNETGTNVYVDESDTGTDSLNPDTDGDGVCDGANSVPPFCIADQFKSIWNSQC